jgi:CTP synthase
MFTGVDPSAIVLLPNADTIYRVPLTLESAGIGQVITQKLGLRRLQKADLNSWGRVVKNAVKKHRKTIRIAIIAKYTDNQDTYISVFEALRAAAWACEVNVEILWINAEKLERDQKERNLLHNLNGIIVPGGFGERGLEGKIRAAQYSLDNKLPYLGLCLGLQMAVIAAARNSGLKDATSVEINTKAKNKVIDFMADQEDKKNTGASMRLGDYPTILTRGSKARRAYGAEKIIERHRHRLEAANAYRPMYEGWGIIASGLSPDGHLVEVVEAIDHPFFISTQAHPEFRSRPYRPHPLFVGLVKAAINQGDLIQR